MLETNDLLTHLSLSRRTIFRLCGSVIAGVLTRSATASSRRVLIPRPKLQWTEALEIVGKGAPPNRLYNDFCLIRDRVGRWHCIGIVADDNRPEGHLFHCVSRDLLGPYIENPDIVLPPSRLREEIWAPTIVWAASNRALMFYAHGVHEGHQLQFSMRVLESDGRLDHWQPLKDRGLPNGNILFAEKDCRDPDIIWIPGSGEYCLYYVSGAGKSDPANPNEVRVRRSPDLIHWSEPRTVLTTPPGYQEAESVFVLHRNGLFYMWISGFDYGRMSLYISEDPLNFGDPIGNRIEEQSGHACEIVEGGGRDWIGCVRIASRFGNAPGVADLTGVYLQHLVWSDAGAAAISKITRRA